MTLTTAIVPPSAVQMAVVTVSVLTFGSEDIIISLLYDEILLASAFAEIRKQLNKAQIVLTKIFFIIYFFRLYIL